MRKNWLFLILILLAYSCKEKTCSDAQNISAIDLEVSIEPLENELFQVADTTALRRFLDEHPVIRDQFFLANDYPSQSVMLDEVFSLIKNPYTDTLYQQVKQMYGDGELLSSQFEDAFKRIKYYYPEFEAPKIQTVISGFGNDAYLTDSLIILSLDFYLGQEAKYRPDLYEYLLQRMTPEHLVPIVVTFMSNKFNSTDLTQKTMLDEMIFYGKAYQFTKTVMPCTPDHLILGYTPEQMGTLQMSERFIWSYFIDNALIYDKKTTSINRFIGERPSTPEIDARSPGRLGRWLGWQIVQQYLERENMPLNELMERSDARSLLMQSKYTPQSR